MSFVGKYHTPDDATGDTKEACDKVQIRKALPLEPFMTLRPSLNDFG